MNKSNNQTILMFIAMSTMLIDHIGVIFFPHITFLRVIGRLALPLYIFLYGFTSSVSPKSIDVYSGWRIGVLLGLSGSAYISMTSLVQGDYVSANIILLYVIGLMFIGLKNSIQKREKLTIALFFSFLAYFVYRYITSSPVAVLPITHIVLILTAILFPKDIYRQLFVHLIMYSIVAATTGSTMGIIGVLAYILIFVFNPFEGENKKPNARLLVFFRWFYPVHLIILVLLYDLMQ